ncbi:MAG TPA: type II toxin-antitoxin system prevent-host-death family antitoxin, partial [Longimicrobiales bacterium]|nr:type II toxin-antitoxin system prevent-host-death family antitoxin [Longimicrobiales bacterium]
TEISYSHARQNLAQVLDEAEDSQEPVIIKRRGHGDMALIPADELRSLQETAHLLRSPRNARRLLAALQRALEDRVQPRTPQNLRKEVGLE